MSWSTVAVWERVGSGKYWETRTNPEDDDLQQKRLHITETWEARGLTEDTARALENESEVYSNGSITVTAQKAGPSGNWMATKVSDLISGGWQNGGPSP